MGDCIKSQGPHANQPPREIFLGASPSRDQGSLDVRRSTQALGVPAEVRNTAFLGRLVSNGRAGHARFYAGEVRRASRLRQQGLLARELAEIVSRPDADPDQVATWRDAATRSVGVQPAHCRPVGAIAKEFLADLREPKSRQRAVMTGILGLDETVGGFMPGELREVQPNLSNAARLNASARLPSE